MIIPGLNGHPGLLMQSASTWFPDWQPLAFDHHGDRARDGVEGLAERALAQLGADPTPAFICGESFGGTVALTLAHRAPERVAGLILFSTFGWHPSNLARRGVAALAVWSFLGGRVPITMYRTGRLFSLPSQLGFRFSPELFHEYVSRPRADMGAYRTKAELSLTFDARPWLGSIQAPTFILSGTWDPVVPGSAGRELAQLIPNSTLHSLPGGHLVHLVHAERVGALLADWAHSLR
jgi:pimeloyl-ACP methyl ester carboxylesterase